LADHQISQVVQEEIRLINEQIAQLDTYLAYLEELPTLKQRRTPTLNQTETAYSKAWSINVGEADSREALRVTERTAEDEA
jgi:hypothetical protein